MPSGIPPRCGRNIPIGGVLHRNQSAAPIDLWLQNPGGFMFRLKSLGFATLVVALTSGVSMAPAQVVVNVGPAPDCPYGYFDYAPYDFYGAEWVAGGLFIGAGPWFHGPRGFYGHVDNRYDPHNGYHGPLPERGSRPFYHFQGNEARDGQGHVSNAPHEAGREHALPGYHGGGGRPHR